MSTNYIFLNWGWCVTKSLWYFMEGCRGGSGAIACRQPYTYVPWSCEHQTWVWGSCSQSCHVDSRGMWKVAGSRPEMESHNIIISWLAWYCRYSIVDCLDYNLFLWYPGLSPSGQATLNPAGRRGPRPPVAKSKFYVDAKISEEILPDRKVKISLQTTHCKFHTYAKNFVW